MPESSLVEERLTRSIIRAYYDVYNWLGFGFLENVYVLALERELLGRNHGGAREVSVAINYKGQELCTQRFDMVVDEKVIVETKSTRELHPVALRQLYSYLRASTFDVRLLLHFGRQPKFYRLVCSARYRTARMRVLHT